MGWHGVGLLVLLYTYGGGHFTVRTLRWSCGLPFTTEGGGWVRAIYIHGLKDLFLISYLANIKLTRFTSPHVPKLMRLPAEIRIYKEWHALIHVRSEWPLPPHAHAKTQEEQRLTWWDGKGKRVSGFVLVARGPARSVSTGWEGYGAALNFLKNYRCYNTLVWRPPRFSFIMFLFTGAIWLSITHSPLYN